jgi:hypothetical protein
MTSIIAEKDWYLCLISKYLHFCFQLLAGTVSLFSVFDACSHGQP